MTQDNPMPVGTPVRYDGIGGYPEFGIVVHCWFNGEIGGYDCIVAFFGDAFPKGAPKRIPYILRYAALSLTVCSEESEGK